MRILDFIEKVQTLRDISLEGIQKRDPFIKAGKSEPHSIDLNWKADRLFNTCLAIHPYLAYSFSITPQII